MGWLLPAHADDHRHLGGAAPVRRGSRSLPLPLPPSSVSLPARPSKVELTSEAMIWSLPSPPMPLSTPCRRSIPAMPCRSWSGVTPGGKELLIGFEDVVNGTGDNDFQDVVI